MSHNTGQALPTCLIHQTLQHLLDPSHHYIFGPIKDVDARCGQISALMLNFRKNPRQRMAAFYLGLFLDCHIPFFRNRLLPWVPLHELPANIMPSQLTAVDYIGDADSIIKRRPDDAISAIIARSFRVTASQRHNIKVKHTDPGCVDFIQSCLITSLTGNYMHAEFSDPTFALKIEDRIAIFDSLFYKYIMFADVALSEYIISIIHDYSDRSVYVPFLKHARSNANLCLRGKTTTPVMCPIIEKPKLVVSKCNGIVQVMGCAMATGKLWTYLCQHCYAISAYVGGDHRGLKRMSIAVDPFRERGDECAVKCHECNMTVPLIDMHGKMLVYQGGYIIVVCPICNYLSSHRDMLHTTTCEKCTTHAAEALAVLTRQQRQTCHADNKRIQNAVFMQPAINVETRSLVFVPSCQYHHDNKRIKIV